MFAILLIAAVFAVAIVPAFVAGIVKDGSPFRKSWWDA
jgi:hypothetical protein